MRAIAVSASMVANGQAALPEVQVLFCGHEFGRGFQYTLEACSGLPGIQVQGRTVVAAYANISAERYLRCSSCKGYQVPKSQGFGARGTSRRVGPLGLAAGQSTAADCQESKAHSPVWCRLGTCGHSSCELVHLLLCCYWGLPCYKAGCKLNMRLRIALRRRQIWEFRCPTSPQRTAAMRCHAQKWHSI